MIVKLNYDDMKGNSLSVKVGKTVRKPDIILKVNQSNIEEAVEKYNNFVAVFLYTDSVESLLQFKGLKLSKVRVVINANPSEDGIVEKLASVPSECGIILKLPKNYCDMRVILTLSKMFSNLRVCGGMICNLPPVRLGCIDEKDTDKKRKQFAYVNSCSCIEKPEYLEDIDFEFVDKPIKERTSVTKQRVTLPSFVKYGGIDSF